MTRIVILLLAELSICAGLAWAQPAPEADEMPMGCGASEFEMLLPESTVEAPPFMAQAEPPDDTMFRRGQRMMRGDMGKRREQFEQFRMLKMLEVLELDEQQEGPFMAAFTRFRSRMKELAERRELLLGELADRTEKNDVPQNYVSRIVDDLMKLDVERHDLFGDATNEMEKILRPEQQARLILFQERFDQQVREHLRDMREERRGKSEGAKENRR